MKTRASIMLASASVAALFSMSLASPALAATAAAAPAEEATLGEIVVTARRKSESLQEVPQSVNAVTSDTLQKLNITQFSDIQAVVPGLSLNQNNSGFTATASLRGITYDGTAAPTPTVAEYLNDASVGAVETFQSMFDIGQIEVLKGPQGTNRGVAAPSGAITITTRKPNLSDFGGYVDGTLTDQHKRNLNGAINLPIIKDVLAVRVAGSINQDDFDGTRSVNNHLRPRAVTSAERVSISFEPTDTFNANVMYQHLDRNQSAFAPVVGPGRGTAFAPAITTDDRAAVGDLPTTFRQHSDIVVAQIDSRIFGQHLNYVGAYHMFKIRQNAAGDTGNVLPGIETFQNTASSNETTTQELRLSSDPAPGRWFDYTLGAYYSWQAAPVDVTSPGQLQSGAFGRPGQPISLANYNPAYQIATRITGDGFFMETSFFASGTLHLPWETELTAGVRHITSDVQSSLKISLAPGKIAIGPTSDINIPGGIVVANFGSPTATSVHPTIYNVSLSHHVTRDFLVYANTGSSFRPPATSIGLQGPIVGNANPTLNELTFHPIEKSTSYEAGFKSTWFDGRARVNAAVFRQKFTGLTTLIPGINYNTGSAIGNFDFTASVDALITGFDLEAAYQITPEWNIAAQTSYAHGKITGDSGVPCNTFAADGRTPTFNTGGLVSLCQGGSPSRLPLWSLSVQSEYDHPLTDTLDGFVRGLLTYTPQNKYIRPNFAADSYSLLNLYVGARSHDGAWEVSLFAKNAFNNQTQLDQGEVPYNLNSSLSQNFAAFNVPSGYTLTKLTPRREIGVNVHYAFGSR